MYGSGGEWHEREFYFQIALNRGVAALTDSESTSQNLVTGYGLDHGKARAIGLAVEKREPAKMTNIPEATKNSFQPGGPFFYYPANWWSHKNHLVLIKAMKLLMEETRVATLVFSGNPSVGTQGYRERMLQLTEHLQLSQHVFFLESVDDATNSWLLQNCAGLCMPSLLGPTNIPPLEALAYSKPVAVSNAHAKEGPLQNAIFLDPRSPEDWSQFMESVIKKVRPVDTGQSQQKLNDGQIRDLLNQLRYDLALMSQ
jgi:glycosyltransferase involved in cell wall biosynthesis